MVMTIRAMSIFFNVDSFFAIISWFCFTAAPKSGLNTYKVTIFFGKVQSL